ncbi:Ten1p TDEL_0E03930 [Torulaspora delbrueckii]|uniref:Uncharacterized protein n=1 Tax=Torulaspora delbrueckii TaxID=4950 RepID=G8ZVJ2_TORDE|nr:hypothetical protein TDEL_0E03930 [Torulaspora delbrueckii]CCE92636.1 hypothetical protein TDEL_0E03930 [Torulaspora delbrueckii]
MSPQGKRYDSYLSHSSIQTWETQSMSRLFIHAGHLARLIANDPQVTAATVRYRLIGQLLEIITVEESLRKQGYVCELQVKDLPEFGRRELQETVRAVVGESIYISQMATGCRGHQPLRGAAVSLCLGVSLLNDATSVFEVLDIQVLTTKEIERLHSFVQSTMGAQFVQ